MRPSHLISIRRLACAVALLACVIPGISHATDDYAKTQFPIVLVHGFIGSAKLGGAVDYWYGIPADLRAHGATVYSADVSSFNDSTVRGEQLLQQVRALLVQTGAKKVNLIGHSQGGPTARYVAAVAPELVASVTTIASPHKGMVLADLFDKTPALLRGTVQAAANALGWLFGFLNGHNNAQNAAGVFHEFTTAGAEAFNKRFPSAGIPANCSANGAPVDVIDGYTQRLYSWTGQGNFTNVFDPSSWVLGLTGALAKSAGETSNDGLISVCSSRYGQVISTSYNWNHMNEVNQFFGLRAPSAEDPVAVIRIHANRLKAAGL
jgi:triacylglycerol lipase